MTETPRNDEAERIVLGALMLDPGQHDAVWTRIAVSDFYLPRHVRIAQTVRSMHAEGLPTGPVAVAQELVKLRLPNSGDIAPYLHSCIASVPLADQAGYFAEEVRRCADRRALIRSGTEIVQSAENPVLDPGHTAREYAAILADMGEADLTLTRDMHVDNLVDFLHGDDDPEDWVIPDLLEREDRMILTGAEGLGKMVLLRQIALMAAAGLHPFTWEKIRPVRVHVVDLENPKRIMRKTLRRMSIYGQQQGAAGLNERMFVDRRPDGLDLMRPENLGWLLRRLVHTDPDLVVIGPLYKLISADPNEERPARQLAEALDMIRTRVGCALLIEAHSGHGSEHGPRPVRPTGSSVWRRWVEFGYGLRLADTEGAEEERRVDFVSWKGDRDERAWPKGLIAGDTWPWQVS